MRSWTLWCTLALLGTGWTTLTVSGVDRLVAHIRAAQFAPELRFDRAAKGYPMSAEPYYQELQRHPPNVDFLLENTDQATLKTGTIPTYFQYREFGQQVRIKYWWFYGYQARCSVFDLKSKSAHNGDWENVMVTLNEAGSAVAAVTFEQHGGHYTRIAGPRDAPCTPGGLGRCRGSSGFHSSGSHPVVYVGKYSHGSYHDDNDEGPDGAGGCAYYGDYRNPSSDADYMSGFSNLIDLDGNQEAWIAHDRNATWEWGYDGISNHPTQHPPTGTERSCTGSPTFAVENAGCYKSECLAGDDQASEDCLKECRHGYDNIGLTCNKGKWPWEWKIYGRLTGGNKYNYYYELPHGDTGLVRRRQADEEWDLP